MLLQCNVVNLRTFANWCVSRVELTSLQTNPGIRLSIFPQLNSLFDHSEYTSNVAALSWVSDATSLYVYFVIVSAVTECVEFNAPPNTAYVISDAV